MNPRFFYTEVSCVKLLGDVYMGCFLTGGPVFWELAEWGDAVWN